MKKAKVKKDISGFFYKVIAVGCLILFALILVSSVIDLGMKLREINQYIEYGFYALVVLLIYLLIILPVTKIVKSPSLAIVTTMDKMDSRAVAVYKKVAKNIVKENKLPNEEVLLLTKYNSNDELLVNLQYVFDKTVKKDLNRIIVSNAKTVMISTAICQSARFDMITVFTVNLKMIKELVVKCGFRPSMRNLSKLTINVFGTALIAEGIENLNIEDILPKTAMTSISEVPMLGKIMESVIQGAANALMTIRIGCVARRYLFNDGVVVTKEDIRKQAYKETVKILPYVVSECITFFPKKVVRFFTKAKNEEEVE